MAKPTSSKRRQRTAIKDLTPTSKEAGRVKGGDLVTQRTQSIMQNQDAFASATSNIIKSQDLSSVVDSIK